MWYSRHSCGRVPILAACLVALAARAVPAGIRPQVEADWALQDNVRDFESGVTAAQDAAGACDGLKDGRWGFHTAHEAQPWWQVDLGRTLELDHVLVYNREEFASRASRLGVLISQDGDVFERVHQHDGSIFRGHSDGQPLRVPLNGRRARLVRLQLPGTDYFHLDEVEIYAASSSKNVALHQPCTQS